MNNATSQIIFVIFVTAWVASSGKSDCLECVQGLSVPPSNSGPRISLIFILEANCQLSVFCLFFVW